MSNLFSFSPWKTQQSTCAGLLSDARVSIAQLANSTQATISVTVESQVCELSMDDLRYTMGPVEKCRGGTCVDKHNVHDVVLIFCSYT